MSLFKKGSKVKIVRKADAAERLGKIGKIIHVNDAYDEFLVEFSDGWDQGHSGNSPSSKIVNRWFYSAEDLKLVRKKAKKRARTRCGQ